MGSGITKKSSLRLFVLPIYNRLTHYNGASIIREPSSEEMEEYFQEHMQRKAARTSKAA